MSEPAVDNWRYFGRTAGGPEIFEILRFPKNGLDLDHQDWAMYPEWLQPDGSWEFYPCDITICNERLMGDFCEDIDEITKEKVEELYARWILGHWPGRQKSRFKRLIYRLFGIHFNT
jgi:hypothetical protein